MGSRPRSLLIAAGPLVLAHAALLAVYDLGRWPILTLLLIGLAFVALLWAARRLAHEVSAASLLLVAALCRVLLLPLPPTLSDDILRYGWDGKVLTAGHNPYLLSPDADELRPLRDARWKLMPHRDVPTVYPPLALTFFSIASWLPNPDLSLKILLSACDLLACWLLLRLAAAHGLRPGRTLAYCWNPLVSLEIAGMGHVDALLVLAQIAAVWWLGRRPLRAAAAAAAAVLAKLIPLIAVPMWARQSRRPVLFVATTLALTAVAMLPVVVSTNGVPPGLVKYGVSWEFNGPLYEPLWRLYERLDLVPIVKSGLDRLKQITDLHDFWNRFYPYVYPQFLAKLTLAGIFAWLWLGCLRLTSPIAGSGRIFGSFILCSATFYPWYLLWVLPWAALAQHRAWLALSALIQLSYLPQLTGLPLFPWIFAAIWLPFFALLVRSRWSTD